MIFSTRMNLRIRCNSQLKGEEGLDDCKRLTYMRTRQKTFGDLFARIILAIFVASQSSLALSQSRYEIKSSELPVLHQVSTAYVGDIIYEKKEGIFRDCLVPTFSFEKHYLTIEAGKPICLGSPDDDEFVPSYANDNTRYDGAPGKRNLLLKKKKECTNLNLRRLA